MARTKQAPRTTTGGYHGMLSERPTALQGPTSTLSSATLSSDTAFGRLGSNLSEGQSDMTKSSSKRSASPSTPATSSSMYYPRGSVSAASPPSIMKGHDEQFQRTMRPFDEANACRDLQRALSNDQLSVQGARRTAAKQPKFALYTKEDKARKLDEAALHRLDVRRGTEKHVSCKYPEFKGYITPYAYGRTNEGDEEKNERFKRQIEMMRLAHYASGGRSHRHDDGEDDEEQPPTGKKLEGEIKREFSDIKEYVEPHQPRASQGRARTHSKDESEDEESEEDSEEDESEDEDSNEDDTIQVHHRRAQTGRARRAKDGESDSEDEAPIPLVAISRGLPLPEGAAMPALSYINLKQRFATGVRCVEQAVIRGQLPAEDDKKSSSKKRASEHRERYGGVSSARKRAKTEMEVCD